METRRNYGLDFLKIIATTIIVFHHFQQVVVDYGLATDMSKMKWYVGDFYWGNVVELFFVISGYLSYRYVDVIKKKEISLKYFWVKRIVRLAPMLFFGAVVYEINTALFKKIFGSYFSDNSVKPFGVILDIIGIQDGWVFHSPGVNNPTWYCSVLMLCYIVFYIITSLSSRIHYDELYSYVFVCLLGCGIKNYDINLPFLNSLSARGFYAFFAGIILARFLYEKKINKVTFIISGFIFGAFIIAYSLWPFLFSEYNLPILLSFVIYPALIIFISSDYLQCIFSSRVFGLFGRASYDVFIIHGPMLPFIFLAPIVINKTIDVNSRWSLIIFALLMWIIGIILYLAYEKPVQKKMEHMFGITKI